MNESRNLRMLWVVPLMGFLLLAAPPAEAQPSAAPPEIATMAVHGGSVSFAPRVSFDRMALRVSGGDYVSNEVFAQGQAPVFAPVDEKGFQLPDGTYQWELVVHKRPGDLRPADFSHGSVSADGREVRRAAAPRGARQSGAFTIKNGAVVDPNLVEPESAPATAGVNLAAPAATNDRDGG